MSPAAEQEPAPIVALTILDAETLGPNDRVLDSTRILVTARHPDTNPTHPNVVSVPTQRVPATLMRALCGRGRPTGKDHGLHSKAASLRLPERVLRARTFKVPFIDSGSVRGHAPIVYAVESLLCGKLGLAEAIEKKSVRFSAAPVLHVVGTVLYERTSPDIPGEPVTLDGQEYCQELCEFCNIQVHLLGARSVPESTASYRQILWTTVEEFRRLVEARDTEVMLALFGDRSVHYCVHGLCLTTSYLLLPSPLPAAGE